MFSFLPDIIFVLPRRSDFQVGNFNFDSRIKLSLQIWNFPIFVIFYDFAFNFCSSCENVTQIIQRILRILILGITSIYWWKFLSSISFNPLTPMSDQDRISPYNIKQTSDESKDKYQSGDNKLIQYKILRTNIIRIVWQEVKRITYEFLGVEGSRV